MKFEGAEPCTTERPEAQTQLGGRRSCDLEAHQREQGLQRRALLQSRLCYRGAVPIWDKFLTSLDFSSETSTGKPCWNENYN